MAQKKPSAGDDMTRLKTKIAERRAAAEKPGGDASLRALRKRLKRAQRKKRALALRLSRALGKKSETKPAAASG